MDPDLQHCSRYLPNNNCPRVLCFSFRLPNFSSCRSIIFLLHAKYFSYSEFYIITQHTMILQLTRIIVRYDRFEPGVRFPNRLNMLYTILQYLTYMVVDDICITQRNQLKATYYSTAALNATLEMNVVYHTMFSVININHS